MRFKLTSELCYMAGVMDHFWVPEKSYVGIRTKSDELAQRFVKYAMVLGVAPEKILVEDVEGTNSVHFYHSKIARMIRDILAKEADLPKHNREMAICLVAGMFDSKGKITERGAYIQRMDKADALLLELLGVRTRDTRILNISTLVPLIDRYSLLSKGVMLPKPAAPAKRGRPKAESAREKV
ncbi:Uncharacterised protein [uncultured archaeon]|nr:Uncharacterised protein [uncultured archaeon]